MASSDRPRDFFKICAEKRLVEYLRAREVQLQAQIDQDSDDDVATAEEAPYVKRIVDQYSLSVPRLDFASIFWTTDKRFVPTEQFPHAQFDVRKGKSYEKQVVIFHIPCKGDVSLLAYYTDNFIAQNGPLGFIEDDTLCFDIIDFYDDLERVKNVSESVIKNIKTLSAKLIGEIESHNYNLEGRVTNKIRERKKKISEVSEVLGIPMRKAGKSQSSTTPTESPRLKSGLVDADIEGSYDVFLSYASGDSREALQIYEWIIAAGGRAFLSEKSLKAGDDFAETIRRALQVSNEVWLLLSPKSLKSEWVISEWGAAWALSKRIVPILLRCAPDGIPDRIGRLHCIDFHNCSELVEERFSAASADSKPTPRTKGASPKNSDMASERKSRIERTPTCPNCSAEGKPFLLSPIPSDFVEIENATHECSRCRFKMKDQL